MVERLTIPSQGDVRLLVKNIDQCILGNESGI
jgi:hypothetical protein